LWVDDLRAFERMCPDIDVRLDQQWQEGVDVRHWPAVWSSAPAADVVIAAFACQLPSDYMEAMAARERTPLWMNLDYLSAEDWVVGCHRLPSVKFKGVQKYFFFPGFRPGTGGLVRDSSRYSPTKTPGWPVGWTSCRPTGMPLISWCRKGASSGMCSIGSVSKACRQGMFISATP
jgi:uncharacterized repeat protein (TIGR03837 family)